MSAQTNTTGEFQAVSPTSTLDHRGGRPGTALRFAFVAILTTGVLLPAVATWTGELLFPAQAHGSLIERDGKVVGSALIAQPFADAKYFHSRPSAAGYDPKAMAGSNWAPSNPALRERIAAASAETAAREGVQASAIPADFLTASGSGMDPHISVAAAELQLARVARVRQLEPAKLRALVRAHTEQPTWGVLGQARVNVLQLNLAMDAQTP